MDFTAELVIALSKTFVPLDRSPEPLKEISRIAIFLLLQEESNLEGRDGKEIALCDGRRKFLQEILNNARNHFSKESG